MARTPRTPATVADAIDPTLDQRKLSGAMVQMRSDAQQDQLERDARLGALQQQIGAINFIGLQKSFLRAAEIRLFEQVRDSNDFKDLAFRDADGNLRRAETLVEFCPLAFGKSYSAMAEAEQNLQALGEEAYDCASRLGVNRSALRATRALPPETLAVVRAAITSGSSKAEVLSVIEDLAAKVEEATQATTEARAELDAKDQLLAEKGKRIDQLKAAQKRFDKLPPNEQLADLKKEAAAVAADAEAAILGGLRQALLALNNAGTERGECTVFMAGLVGQVQAKLSALREEFSLPDVSNAADQRLAAEMNEWDK